VISEWFPRQERARAVSIIDVGGRIGTTLAFPTVAALAVICGWRIPFLVAGVLGLVWIPFWLWLYRHPRDHPHVSKAELIHIAGCRPARPGWRHAQ
jgi:ACS family D-galactonate transporter-like MFS transporter